MSAVMVPSENLEVPIWPIWLNERLKYTNSSKITFRLMEECGIAMYCDLHAHSRKHNVFIYGCENKRFADKRLQEQVFPLMLHKNAADKVLQFRLMFNNYLMVKLLEGLVKIKKKV